MKLLLSLCFSLINSVAFLLYLNSVKTFLPFDVSGSYNWSNIITVIVLIGVGIFSLLGILLTLGQIPFKKKLENTSWYISIKFAGIVTLFLLAFVALFFFHILTWYWIVSMCVLLGILIVIV